MTRPADRSQRVKREAWVFGQSRMYHRAGRDLCQPSVQPGNPPPTQSYGVTSKRPGSTRSNRRTAQAPASGRGRNIRIDFHRAIWTRIKRESTNQRRRRGPTSSGGLYGRENQRSVTSSSPAAAATTNFPFQVLGFHSTTARNTSTGPWPRCWSLRIGSQVAFAAVQRQCPGGKQNGAVVRKLFGLQPYPAALRTAHQRLQPAVSQPYIKFPPPLFLPRDPHGQPRQTTQGLSLPDHDDAL